MIYYTKKAIPIQNVDGNFIPNYIKRSFNTTI